MLPIRLVSLCAVILSVPCAAVTFAGEPPLRPAVRDTQQDALYLNGAGEIVSEYHGKTLDVYVHKASSQCFTAEEVYQEWTEYENSLKKVFDKKKNVLGIKPSVHIGHVWRGGGKAGPDLAAPVTSRRALWHELFHTYHSLYIDWSAGSFITEGWATYFDHEWEAKQERKKNPEKYSAFKGNWYTYPPTWAERHNESENLQRTADWFQRKTKSDIFLFVRAGECMKDLEMTPYGDLSAVHWYLFTHRLKSVKTALRLKDEVIPPYHKHRGMEYALDEVLAKKPIHLSKVIKAYTAALKRTPDIYPDAVKYSQKAHIDYDFWKKTKENQAQE